MSFFLTSNDWSTAYDLPLPSEYVPLKYELKCFRGRKKTASISVLILIRLFENDKIKVTKKGKIKTTKIGYFFDCKKIV